MEEGIVHADMDRARAEARVQETKKPLLRTCSRGADFLALSYWHDGRVRHALVTVSDSGQVSLGTTVFPTLKALALRMGAQPAAAMLPE